MNCQKLNKNSKSESNKICPFMDLPKETNNSLKPSVNKKLPEDKSFNSFTTLFIKKINLFKNILLI